MLELSGRVSDRVPFGTGPALARIPAASEDYVSHARDAFRSLAEVLAAMRAFAVSGTWQPPAHSVDWLEQLGWARFQPRLDAVETQSQRQRRLHEWFDGFRTMRYLRLAAARYPQRPLLETLRSELVAADRSMTAEELLGLLRHNGNPFTLS